MLEWDWMRSRFRDISNLEDDLWALFDWFVLMVYWNCKELNWIELKLHIEVSVNEQVLENILMRRFVVVMKDSDTSQRGPSLWRSLKGMVDVWIIKHGYSVKLCDLHALANQT